MKLCERRCRLSTRKARLLRGRVERIVEAERRKHAAAETRLWRDRRDGREMGGSSDSRVKGFRAVGDTVWSHRSGG